MKSAHLLTAVCFTLIVGKSLGGDGRPDVLNIGSRLELFVDGHLVDRMQGVTQKLHSPVRRDVSLEYDKPWEGPTSHSVQILREDGLYRMYYRGCQSEAEWAKRVTFGIQAEAR